MLLTMPYVCYTQQRIFMIYEKCEIEDKFCIRNMLYICHELEKGLHRQLGKRNGKVPVVITAIFLLQDLRA